MTPPPGESKNRPSVLIIDDEVAIGDVYVDLLRMEGVQAQHVPSGEAALELLEKMTPPDLVFVDCLMPQMSGETFVSELARRFPDVRRNTWVVGLSGLDAHAPRARTFASVCDVLETKPTDLDVFLSMYDRTMATARARG